MLADWVGRLGITDREIRPNHAWRYTFKQVAARNGITKIVSDASTGHTPLTVGRGYPKPTLEDMAAALRCFPRYEVDPTGARDQRQLCAFIRREGYSCRGRKMEPIARGLVQWNC